MIGALRQLLAAVLAAATLLLPASADDSARWTGTFSGEAEGRSVTLSLQLFRDQVAGRLIGWEAAEQRLSARREGVGAVGTLLSPQGLAYVALEPAGDRVRLVIIPAGPDGQADHARARALDLNRTSADPLPAQAARPAAPAPTGAVDVVQFVRGYQAWSPADTASAVVRILPERRRLIAMFGALHADVYLSVCAGVGAAALPADLTERQGLDCAALLAETARLGARFDRASLQAEARTQGEALVRLVECDRGNLPQERCKDAGLAVAEGLRSWADASQIIARYTAGAAP